MKITDFLRHWMKRGGREPAHIRTGLWGEKLAKRLLRKKGYRLLAHRYRVGPKDEIDIICRDRDILVFVEVKTRRNESFGRPAEAVNRSKRHYLSRAAVRYIKKLKKPPPYIRFDIVEVVGCIGDEAPAVHHIENAFQLDSCYRLFW